MSVKGLEESEKIAAKIQKNVLKSLKKQKLELEDELAKVQYLLSDPEALKGWRTALAGPERVSALYAMLDETERLYLEAGDTEAAKIFKKRMEAQLKQKLTNIKANKIEVEMRIAKSKVEMQGQLQNGLTEVRREGALREMYTQARGNGGFFANFGRPYLTDLITLETKAAGSKTIGEYMSDLYNKYEAGLKNVFINGIIRGDSYQTMENNLIKATDITAGKAKLLVRTESNAIFNQSVLDVINDNPLVKGYRFRAVLDSHTSKICQEHDGQYIPKEDVQPGVNYPPLHPNCRSTVTTVLVDEDEKKDMMQRYTKNKLNQWEKVPPGMTYQEYKDKFGFSNSKNPRTYNGGAERSIHELEPMPIATPSYQGYVKPSKSATARVQKYKDAYGNYMVGTVASAQEDYDAIIDAVKENTEFNNVGVALLRQAQAESGFDMLPMQATRAQFNKEVEKKGYKVIYKKFTTDDDFNDFVSGKMSKLAYAFDKPSASGGKVVRMALRSSDAKILKPGQDSRISDAMDFEDEHLMRLLAVEYGYDAIEYPDGKIDILNRTAVIVEDPQSVVKEVLPVQEPIPPEKELRVSYTRKDFDDKKKDSFVLSYDSEIARSEELLTHHIRESVANAGVKEYYPEDVHHSVRSAFIHYTGLEYEDMNEALRDMYEGNMTQKDEGYVQTVKDMTEYMYQNRIGKAVTVGRRTDIHEIRHILGDKEFRYNVFLDDNFEGFKDRIVGKESYMSQFESTTIAPEYIFHNASGYRLDFVLPESTPAMYINGLSNFKDQEFEVLIAPGVKYQVVDATVEGKVIVLKCVVLENDFNLPERLAGIRTVNSKEE